MNLNDQNQPVEVIRESKPFEFTHNEQKYSAYVRYYSDCNSDVELIDSEDEEAYDKAWKVAEELDLLTRPYTQVINLEDFSDKLKDIGWLPRRED